MPDIFLSYSRDDQSIARRFAEGFEREGLSVWWDATLNPGEAYDKVTEQALEEARAVVVLWSRMSVDSRWVRSEATQANSTGTLVPVMIEPCKRPVMFELTHTADLTRWKGDTADAQWREFVAGLRRFVGTSQSAQGRSTPDPASRSVNTTLIAVAVMLLLMAGAALLLLNRDRSATPAVATPPAVAGAPGSPAEKTLAVLPFINLSSDNEQEYFADGLTEELLNQLAQVKNLRVTARTSSFAFKGKTEDLREIGRKLDVANILEGSVRKDGTHLAITVQLIDTRTNDHLWSNTYKRELVDIFSIQEDVARNVAAKLQIALGVGSGPAGERGTDNLEAYDMFLRANALAGQADAKATVRAKQLYQDAVKLDPAFIDAWAGLYVVLSTQLGGDPEAIKAKLKEVQNVVDRLNEVAPNSPTLHNLRSNLFLQQRKWKEAEAELQAVTMDDRSKVSNLPFMLAMTGRVNESLPYFEQARRSDPLNRLVSAFLTMVLDQAGRLDEAQAEYQRAKDIPGSNAYQETLALYRLWVDPRATPAQVEAQFKVVFDVSHPSTLERQLSERPGDRAGALVAIRAAFNDPSGRGANQADYLARLADHFGDRDLALAALHRSLIEFQSHSFTGLWWPFETKLRADPRFKQLLRDIGLADFYLSTGRWPDFCKPVGKADFECH